MVACFDVWFQQVTFGVHVWPELHVIINAGQELCHTIFLECMHVYALILLAFL